MKKILFLAHDPGGYDVVYPVVQALRRQGCGAIRFYTAGPAAKLNPLYGVAGPELLHAIKGMLANREVAGLVTGTSWGNDLELQAITAGKQAGVPTVAILDYWSNYQARFVLASGETMYPDYYIVMDELAEKEAIESGIPPAIIRVLGHPGLDTFFTCQPRKGGPVQKEKKILFLSQPLSVLYGESLGYTGRQALADCCKLFARNNNYRLQVKFHPKDETCFQQQYARLAVTGNLSDIMPAYDLVIGMSTMGLLHAVLMGVPAISYQPGLRQQDQCITNKLGLTALAASPPELERLVKALLTGQPAAYSGGLSRKLIWLDGHSTERAAGFIMEVCT